MTTILTFLTPLTIYGLYFGCDEVSGCPPPPSTWLPRILAGQWASSLFDAQAFWAYLGWYAFTVAAWKVLPGDWVEGTLMRNGERKLYKINGAY